MSDERKNWKLIAEAREWSRIVETSPDWRKGYVEDGLYHVDRLSKALEAVLIETDPERASSAHWLRDSGEAAGFGATDVTDDDGGWR